MADVAVVTGSRLWRAQPAAGEGKATLRPLISLTVKPDAPTVVESPRPRGCVGAAAAVALVSMAAAACAMRARLPMTVPTACPPRCLVLWIVGLITPG